MNITNSYYEDEPIIYTYGIRISGFFTLIFGAIGVYFIIYRSQQMNNTFRYMLLFHLISAVYIVTHMAILSFPLMQLPYISFKPIGLLTDLKVSSLFQGKIILILLGEIMACIIVLFYYRMDLLLHRNHILKKPYIRFSIYISTYIVVPLLSYPIIDLTYEDQEFVKESLFQEFRIISPDIFVPTAFAVRKGNVGLQIAMIYYPLVLFYYFLLLLLSSWIISDVLRKNSKRMSKQTRNIHINVIRSLSLSFACFVFLFGTTNTPLMYLCFTQSWRADVWNLCIFSGSLAVPTICLVFAMTYKPYRNILLGVVVETAGNSTFVVSISKRFDVSPTPSRTK